jgi:isocitrate/isopropylmalate dehydrogenase
VLDYGAAGDPELADAAASIRRATFGATADGVRTFDIGGEASTSDVVDEVIRRMQAERRA